MPNLVKVFIDTSEVDRLAARIKGSAHGYRSFLGRELGFHARLYKEAVVFRAPKSSRTDSGYKRWQAELGGPLHESIEIEHPNSFKWEITEGAEYGQWVREGNGPATFIGPKFAKMLWWPGLAEPIAWVGTNPAGIRLTADRSAQEPNPYHEKAVNDVFPTSVNRMAKVHVEYLGRHF